MADEILLPQVAVHRLTEHALGELKALFSAVVRDALDARQRLRVPPGALRAPQAAAYIGISKSLFYQQLKEYPELQAASFTIGKARCWPIPVLDEWIAVHRRR
jgi:predicted DNA-binding transcriptional regulator AlpA